MASTSSIFNISVPPETGSLSLGEIIDRFKRAVAESGLPPPAEVIADGKLHRFSTNDKAGDSAGWYVLYVDGVPSGAFGDWRSGTKASWCSKSHHELSDEQWQKHQERIEAAQREAEEDRKQRQDQTAIKANEVWQAASEAPASHPYLVRKRIGPHGARIYRGSLLIGGMDCDGALIIPLYNREGALRSLEFVSVTGDKRFAPGGEKQGCFYPIGKPGPIICIAEGAATAGSVHEATGYPVIVAFDAGNLSPVAKVVRELYPESLLVFCADNDGHREDNPGISRATEAAGQVQGVIAIPDFTGFEARWGDFNDLAGFGPALVKQQIEKAIARYRQSGEKEEQDTPQSSTSTKARIDEDQRTYERLAKLTPGEYDRVRKEEANRLGIQLRTLDKEVAKRCDNEGGGAAPGQGRSIEAFELEPWAGPVSGEAILTALCQTFKRFTIMPDGSYETVALWVIHTYAHEAAYVSPILGITSPQKRCGKTTLQTLLAALVNRPLPTSNISPAAVFRCIEAWCPTLLIDEGDSFLRDNEELRGVINSGHTRATAFVVRTEEIAGKREPVKFSTWAPKAIALIGGLPSTIHDRAIGVPMRRKLPTESVEKLRQDKLDFEPLRRKIKRWSQDNVELLKIYDPAMPSGLNDRAADNWRPLLAIADLVGGDWSKLAREAIKHLATGDDDHEEERIKLLADIRDIFIERQTDRIASADLVDDLGRMEDRPWPEWKNGKPITQNQLARLLKPFKIKPSVQRIGTKTPSCYELASFKDAFSRYLPTFSTSTPQQPSNSAEFGDFQSSTSAPDVEVQNSSKPAPDLHCWGVEVQNPPLGEKEESETVYSDVEVRNPNNDDSEEF